MPTFEKSWVIHHNSVIDNIWQQVENEPQGFRPKQGNHYLLPVAEWLEAAPDFSGYPEFPGVWLDGGDSLESIADAVKLAPIIAIHFSGFTDGSGFSAASTLIEEYGYEGELRAFGAILPDQAPYLLRCGFNSLAFATEAETTLALNLIQAMASSYQGSVDQPRTPFARRFGG